MEKTRTWRHSTPKRRLNRCTRARLAVELLEDRTVPSLVAAFGFNEGTGLTVSDASGNGNNGTISNASWNAAGKFGGALSFNGTSSWVTVPDAAALHLTTGMTLEAWVEPTAASADWTAALLKERPGGLAYGLYAADGAGKPPAGYVNRNGIDVSAAGTALLPLNAWSHLAVTYDGAAIRLYVNGTQVGSKSQTGGITSSTDPLRIGGDAVWGEYFAGLIDEVRVYDNALTAAQVQTDMNTPINGTPDTTPPTVSLTAPADGATVSGTITVTATASDDIGVAGVQFKLDGANLGAESTTAPYSITWNTQSVPSGAHTLTAVARDAAGNSTTSAAVGVTVSPDFSFTIVDPVRTVSPNGDTFYEVDVAYLNGFTSSSVNLWFQNLPAGVTGKYAFNPMSHQGRTELFITTTNATPGTYTFLMGATAEGKTHSQSATLIVSTTPDFAVAVAPSSQNVTAGNSIQFQVTLTKMNDFADTVTFSVPGLPSGMSASFSPPSAVPPANATLTISTTTDAVPGVYNLNVTGTSGSLTHSAPITVTVQSTNAVWNVGTIGSTGVPNNNVRVGALKGDGKQRVYVGTIQTGRMLEYSWNGSGWSGPIDVGGSPTGAEIHNVTIGPGRGDGQDRIYAASTDSNIYEIWFNGSSWQQMVVGTLDNQAMHAAVGVGRNDGVTRVYAASTQTLYEFTWNGSSWTKVTIGSTPGSHGVAVGKGHNDNTNYVYVASISSGTFEARFVNNAWTIASMGDSGDVRDVELGIGRNDGVRRVYAPLLDGRVREFTWNGTGWTIAHTPAPPGALLIHAYILAGRNDGIQRVYTSSGNGQAYEFTWNGSAWTVYNMGGGSDYLYGFHFGVGRNDGLMRLYGADRGSVNQVYEYTWTGSAADSEPPTAPGNLTASGGVATASLTWTAATDNVGVVRHNVHRSTVSGFVPTAGNRIAQPTGTSYSDMGLAAGTYYYLVTAEDAAGNLSPPSNQASANVVADTTSPTVSITSPANGASVSGTITVTANASDDVGVAGVQFLLDGANLGAENTSAPFSVSWITSGVSNGTHSLTARARDTSGNTATSATVTVTVSNTPGLVLALGFNEGTGTTTADVSGNANNGTISYATWTTTGKFGKALSFNGTNAWVTVTDNAVLHLTNGMTLEAWVNPTALGAWHSVILKERPNALSYALYATDPNRSPSAPAGFINTGGSDVDSWGDAALALNTWTHLAATYDGSNLRVYVNGALIRTQAVTGNIVETNDVLRIGGNSVWGEYFSGLIDEVRIYSRALSQTELQTDMNTPVGGGGGGLQLDGPPSPTAPVGALLTEASLFPIRAVAAARWAALGLRPEQIAALNAVPVHVADLPGAQFGFTSAGAIWMDRDAGGYGWFIDPTPADDSEFPAGPSSPAFGKADVLTVLAHEMGHALGLEHDDAGDPDNLMHATLPLGVRRLPNSTSDKPEPERPGAAIASNTRDAQTLDNRVQDALLLAFRGFVPDMLAREYFALPANAVQRLPDPGVSAANIELARPSASGFIAVPHYVPEEPSERAAPLIADPGADEGGELDLPLVTGRAPALMLYLDAQTSRAGKA